MIIWGERLTFNRHVHAFWRQGYAVLVFDGDCSGLLVPGADFAVFVVEEIEVALYAFG